ncbi:MAG: YggT family protein, partial [Burkholderiaceae bacterium]|nr:YggT family protein [Burkholderiaceae bacterium]
MQWFGSQLGAEQRKLIGVYLFPLTNWIVIPLRRVIPSIGLLDTASLLAAYLLVFGKVA